MQAMCYYRVIIESCYHCRYRELLLVEYLIGMLPVTQSSIMISGHLNMQARENAIGNLIYCYDYR